MLLVLALSEIGILFNVHNSLYFYLMRGIYGYLHSTLRACLAILHFGRVERLDSPSLWTFPLFLAKVL
jgi:hypothetical protein